MSPAYSLAGCCLAWSLLLFARAGRPPPPFAAFRCHHPSRRRPRHLEMRYHGDPRPRRAANATDSAKYPPSNGYDRSQPQPQQNVDRLRVDLLRTQLTARTAQDRARLLEAELGEMTRNFNIVRNALREERKRRSNDSRREQPEAVPSSDTGGQRMRSGDGNRNRTRTSDGTPTEELPEGLHPKLPPMAAALFVNAEREEREKRLRRGPVEKDADSGGEAPEPGQDARAVGRTNTTAATATVLVDDKNEVAAAEGSDTTQLSTAAATATTTKREKKTTDCPLPAAKEADSSQGTEVVGHHVTATATNAIAVVGEEENTALAAGGRSNATRPSTKREKKTTDCPLPAAKEADSGTEVVGHHVTATATNAIAVVGEEENTALAAGGRSNATRPSRAAAVVATNITREHNKYLGVNSIEGDPPYTNSTNFDPTNKTLGQNATKLSSAAAAVNTEAKRDHNESPAVGDTVGNFPCTNSSVSSHDNGDEQLQALRQQCASLRRRLSRSDAAAHAAAAHAAPDEGLAGERDAWRAERAGLELAWATVAAERECLAARLERQQSAMYLAGLLCRLLGDRCRAWLTVRGGRRPPPSPRDRMLAVLGGGDAAPKRGARRWLQWWNAGTTGGGRLHGPAAAPRGDRGPAGGGVRPPGGTGEGGGARPGSRARRWLRQWNAGNAGGRTRRDDERPLRRGGPDPTTADESATAPRDGPTAAPGTDAPPPGPAPPLLVRQRRRHRRLGRRASSHEARRNRETGVPAAGRGKPQRRE